MSRVLKAALLGVGILLLPEVARAVGPEPAEGGWLGRTLAEVSFHTSPTEDVKRLRVLAALEPGQPFSPLQVRRAVKALFQLGRFDNVRVEGSLTKDGRVALRLSMPPKPVLRQLRLDGSQALSAADFEEAARLKIGGPINSQDLPEQRSRLAERLARLGYRQAAIGLALQQIDENGGFDLVARVDEGPQTVLRRLVIKGAPRWSLRVIADALGIRPGEVVDLNRLDAALAALTADYRRAGFLDAQLAPPEVRELPDTLSGRPLADVVLDIDSGPMVNLRVNGNQSLSTREILLEADLLNSLGTSRSVLTELRDRVEGLYERNGFYRPQVEIAVRTTPAGDKKEILVSIGEGPQAAVATLEFPGNTILDPEELIARVRESVEQGMADELERPGADGEAVSGIVGGRSVRGRSGQVAEPDTTPPDPTRLYLARAYRSAADSIADLYRNQGYQSVKVGAPIVEPREGGDLLDIDIPIEPGVRWVLGAMSFSGNESVPGAELFELSGLDPTRADGEAMDFAKVEDARRAIINRYQNLGHLFVSLSEKLRQVPARGSLVASDYVRTSSVAPLDAQKICAQAEARNESLCEVELVFVVSEGPRVKTRNVIVRGALITDEDVVKKQISVQPATVLSAQDMIDTRDNLLRVGVFERVTVRPLDESEVAAEKDVVVELKEKKRYALELGVGASTEEGARVFASFADGNVLGTALRMQLQGKANYFFRQMLALYSSEIGKAIDSFYGDFSDAERLEYELAFGLTYPRIFSLPPGFSTGLDLIVLRNYDPAFRESTQSATLVGNYKGFRPELVGGPRPVGVQLRIGAARSDLKCNPAIKDLQLCDPDLDGVSVYATVGPRLSWDLRDDTIDPKAGAYLEFGTELAKGLEQGSNDLLSLDARAQAYVPIVGRVSLAWTFQVARVFPLRGNIAEVPVNRRLFSGGRSTIRGYAEKTLRPQDVRDPPPSPPKPGEMMDETPTSKISAGGLLSASLKNELRIGLFGPVSFALFYDVGDLWESGHFHLSSDTVLDQVPVTRRLAQGAGFGLRVATPIGPLAVDLGFPVDARDDQGPQLHFAVGNF